MIKALTVVVMGLLAVPGCSESGGVVRIVLPNDYKGDFAIVLDIKNGKAVPLKNGEHRFVVPEDGICNVLSLEPIEVWHKEIYEYADGREIPRWTVKNLGAYPGSRKTPNGTVSDGTIDGARIKYRVEADKE